MVIRAEHVDQDLEATLAFVEVIGDIRSEIRLDAVLAHDDAIFIVAELRGAKPLRAVLLVHAILLTQFHDRAIDRTAGRELALRGPAIEAHTERGEIIANLAEHLVEAVLQHLLEADVADQFTRARDHGIDILVLVTAGGGIRRQVGEHLRGGLLKCVADLHAQQRCYGENVVAAIRVLRKDNGLPALFDIAQPDTDGEDLHLSSRVVDVELAVHIEARSLQQIAQRGAISGLPTMTHMHRPGGIRGDELEIDLAAGAEVRPAVALALLVDADQFLHVHIAREKQIDEAGARDLGLGHERRGRQRPDDAFGDVPRLALRGLGEAHRDVAGKVAMHGIARALERHEGRVGQARFDEACVDLLQGLDEEAREFGLQGGTTVDGSRTSYGARSTKIDPVDRCRAPSAPCGPPAAPR